MAKPIIYIAAPFRAATSWGIVQNIRIAEEAAHSLAREEVYFHCPHTMTANFHGEVNDKFWLDMTMAAMERCDAVYVVGEWQKSSGVKAEILRAAESGIPVFEDFGTLLSWVDTWEAGNVAMRVR